MVVLANAPLRLSILSSPEHLPVVRAALERVCELLGFGEDARGEIVLAVDEALTNVIRHAYHGRHDRPIEVILSRVEPPAGGALQIVLRDWGDPVDPGRIKSRDLAEVRPGGLGVHIMTNCMDSVEYAHAADGGTRLTLTKTLPARSDA